MASYDSAENVPNKVTLIRDAEGGTWGRVRDTMDFAPVNGGKVLSLDEVIDLYGPVQDITGENG
ncbi:hypothetical protein AB0F72_08515 [Actinoplanes sp. NPDC023936]|uniref:hypothetical protein n=1 Tax=Actinoplanes sp. NPDC023936 TaxID=3154910 RepID=UPI0033E806E7